jgi:hypothetical protein
MTQPQTQIDINPVIIYDAHTVREFLGASVEGKELRNMITPGTTHDELYRYALLGIAAISMHAFRLWRDISILCLLR